ncbi:nucleotide-diphospho-sugar transferase [bacterium]|nr:nucleotide-diphospho-sugar transferase [bacterium]
MNTAVLLITFNRLDCLKKVFEKVALIKPKRLYISSDGWRENKVGEKEKVLEVRKWLLENVNWDCDIHTRFLEQNSGGCKNGVSSAISWMFETEEEGIILEDDCVPSLSFFAFCEKLLEKYKGDKKVYSICGYIPVDSVKSEYPYEFATMSHCWGWATWKNKWKDFSTNISDYTKDDIEALYIHKDSKKYWQWILKRVQSNEIDSWYFPWNFYIAKNKGLTIFPTKNLISNNGDMGVHYENSCQDKRLNTKIFELEINKFNPKYTTKNTNKTLWDNFYLLQSGTTSKLNFFEYLFSIKNSHNKKHKIIRILGFKIKLKRK